MDPKISVIIPYYNAERWIVRCAESLKQQEGDFEFIFVNDHSTDGGYKALKEATENDRRFIRITEATPDGHGVSWARNTGLTIAKGEWVTFLDADDEYLPDAMWKYMSMIKKADADIHQANHVRHYVKKGVTDPMYTNEEGTHDLNDLPEAWFGVWNKIYKRELAQSLRFDEAMKYGEDEIFNLEALDKARRIHTGNVYTVQHNIENENSLSRSRTGDDLCLQLMKLAEFILDHKDPLIRRAAYNALTTHTNASWYFSAICGEE